MGRNLKQARRWVLLLVGVLFFGISFPAEAAPCHQYDDPAELSHTPPGQPTEVEIGVFLLDITHISNPSDEFPRASIDMFLDLRWQDGRLEFTPAQNEPEYRVYVKHAAEQLLDSIWQPDIIVENEIGRRITEAVEVIIYADGTVEYEERLSLTVGANFDLARFPFDTQVLEVDIESFEWSEQHVIFRPRMDRIGYDTDMTLLQWKLTDVHTQVRSEQEIRSTESFSEFVYQVEIRRRAGQYFWKTLLPFLVVVMVSWSVFWMTGEDSSSRMGRTFIALLTVVAFHRSPGFLPSMPTISFIDVVVLIAYASIIATVVLNIIVHTFQQRDEPEKAVQSDMLARRYIPAVFMVLFGAAILLYLF